VLGGQVPLMFDQMSTSIPQIRAGKLRPLGVTSRTRSPLLPDVPTIAEQGLPGYEDVTWNGLMAPADTPRDILERLRVAVVSAVSAPKLRQRFLERAIELEASRSLDEYSAFVRGEVTAFQQLARDADLKAE